MARARGARTALAAAFETTYGTTPESGFFKLPFASASLSRERALLENELLGFGRDPLAPVPDVETTDGDIVIPIDAEAFGFWLKAVFGDPTTTGSGPYTHVFESGEWDIPSLSIETGMPDASHFAMAAGAKVDSLSFTMQRGGQLQATVSLVAQGETVASSTDAGTPTEYDLIRFGQFNGAITRGGSALGNVVSASLTYSNNLDRIETIRSDGKIEDADTALASLSGEIVVRFANTALLTQATDGTAAAFTFAFSKTIGSDTYSVTFSVPKVYLPVPRRAVEGPEGVQATFAFQAAQDDDGDPMLTVTLINDVASY